MPSTTVVVVALLPVLLFSMWYLSSVLAASSVPDNLRNKRIILLIAHPDDESMFFAPTLQALTNPLMGNHLKVLCMSTGNADGLGETRRKELEAAALTLGVRRREDIFVMDDDRFKDGMKEKWEPREIARVLAQAFAPQLITPSPPVVDTPKTSPVTADKKEKEKKKSVSSTSSSKVSRSFFSSKSTSSKSSSKSSSTKLAKVAVPEQPPAPPVPEGPRATIDILLTFDKNGISSHPNHIALYDGATIFLQQIMRNHSGYRCPVDLYTLTTVNILRKYSFMLDVLPTYISGIFGAAKDGWTRSKAAKAGKNPKDDRVVFFSDIGKYFGARKAMVSGHASQMVWFRWGWIGLGRYMVLNDLRRETVPGT